MSRIGKTPISLGDKVDVKIEGTRVTVSGPRGSLEYTLPDGISIDVEDTVLVVRRESDTQQARTLHGTARSRLQGMVNGVSEGFRKELQIQGVGYRGQCSGQKMTLNLGYSQPVEYQVPDSVDVNMPNPTTIVLESINKQQVGQVAAVIRGFRPPDAYKGKGIRYAGEQISLKEGKTVG